MNNIFAISFKLIGPLVLTQARPDQYRLSQCEEYIELQDQLMSSIVRPNGPIGQMSRFGDVASFSSRSYRQLWCFSLNNYDELERKNTMPIR